MRGFLPVCLLILSASSCTRSTTEPPAAPVPPRLAPLPPGTPPVAFPALAEHLPRLLSHAEAGQRTRMSLWAIGSDGLRERVFDAGGNAWGDWVVRGVPSRAQHPPALWEDFGSDLFADSGFSSDRPSAVAVWSHPGAGVAPERLLEIPSDRTPFGTAAGFHDNVWDSTDWMRPLALAPSADGSRIHLFGGWFDDGIHDPGKDLLKASFEVLPSGEVRELQAEPQVLPRLIAPVAGVDKEMRVEPGPNSALLVPRTVNGASVDQLMTFVVRKPGGMNGQDGLALWHDDGAGHSGWVDLGTPVAPPSKIVGTPLAVSWINTANGRYTVNVFVVARRDEGNERWELYERYWVDGGGSRVTEGWAAWKSHASPRWDPYDASKGQLLEPGTKWRLTTGLTWELGGVVRMNLFGHADPETDRNGVVQPRRLVEYVWDGANWNWGFHHTPPPSGLGVKTISSAWVNKDGAIRISLACRDENGGILERYYVIDPTGWHGWFWNDLTG